MTSYSVIIATHNRPDTLARAVRSVKDQSLPIADVLVVSDAACETTYNLITPLLGPHDLFVQRRGNPGPAESRNVGIQLLTSDYALFLDDDDELPIDFIENIEKNRPANHRGIVYCDFAITKHPSNRCSIDPPSVQKYSIAQNKLADVYVKNFIPNSCLVYPVKTLKSRRFDTSLVLNEDWDFLLSAMTGASLAHVCVDGPIIHKTEAPRRGNSNDHLLPDVFLSIYQKWPAPTKDLKLARQSLLASSGVSMSLDKL